MLIYNSATNSIMQDQLDDAAPSATNSDSPNPYHALFVGVKLLSQAGAIAILGVLTGYLPGLSTPSPQSLPELSFTAAAQAQTVGEDELYTYVRAAFEIEMLRRQTYNSISSLNNGSVPEITCNNQEAISRLGVNVAGVARNFCSQSAEILQRYSMSPARFNQITASRGSDPNLDARIRQIIQELNPRRSR
jgi:hypothetical protein